MKKRKMNRKAAARSSNYTGTPVTYPGHAIHPETGAMAAHAREPHADVSTISLEGHDGRCDQEIATFARCLPEAVGHTDVQFTKGAYNEAIYEKAHRS